MKAFLIGSGFVIIALGMALGGWLSMSVGASHNNARAAITASSSSNFNYDRATLSDRRLWLTKKAAPLAITFDKTLPTGAGEQPHMSVSGWAVDARRRAIEIQIQVKGQYGIDRKSLPAAKEAMIGQACPSYAQSPLGANRVTLVHTFLGKEGREDLSVEVNPLVCRAYM